MNRFLSGRAARTLVLLTALGLAACDDDEPVGPDGPGPLPDVVSAEVVDTAGSIFRSLRVTLAEEGPIEVFYQPTAGGRVFRMVADSLALTHDVLMPRLRQDTEYHFAVRSYNEEESSDSIVRGTFATDSLPADLLAFQYSVTGTSSFPILMVPFRSGGWAGQVGIESDGAIVWYMESAGGTLVAAPVPNSHDMLFIENGFPNDGGRNGIVRAGPRRDVVALLERTDSPFGRIHHDMTALDESRVLFLAYDTQTVRDTLINGEAIWEWDMTTGEVVKRWSSWDFFDWDDDRGPGSAPAGWLHANSITVGPRGNIVVSSRSWNQVFSIASDWESIEWRIGGPNSTVGLDAEDVFVGQHSATEVADGRVLLFDNRGGGAANDQSRSIELEIDGDTAYSVWEYSPEPPILATLRGGTYRLANGNTVTIFPAIPFEVHEVTPAGDVVWKMLADEDFTATFRAAPWPSIAGETEVDTMP